ncbi:plasminogen activator inhibitor 1 RNA-binding protein isoform X1 [Salmo salar]|uniref:Plasminogen activator inhibitor 1 RNA-binding protein n=1 Tax=Salmo salar TaxID=8030 RepID=B5X151_SALSA|nr:plasminogen activator inhibitor 1 RNA-binding protein isoform X1 [Salmo salar]ACI33032.1 Plasminogen activator inhibitor 1 RNA-binding protein [Salmo salar]|eukprot:XP_013994788.1 PREDICTED: plasminogen activator inhibitor 1 RNA-binding protein-like isoform X1 [Salmo salar]
MPGQLQEGFGCVVTNRFDQLLDDESDPFEVLKAAENKKKEAAAASVTKSAAQAAKQPKKESQKDRKNPLLDKKDETQAPVPPKKEAVIRRVGRRPDQQGQPGTQGGQGEGRPTGDRRPDNRRPPRERRFDKPLEDKPDGGERGEFSADKPLADRPPRGRGGSRAGRGGRGRGMGRGDSFDSRGKRDFDRHSSGDKPQKSEEKRGGSGVHNRGNPKDETSVDAEQTTAPEETPEGVEHPPADSENKENEVEEPKEEGPKEMTLDEWKAMQDKERAKVEFNIRKPNEGADSKWNKGYVLHKSKSEDVSEEKPKDKPAVIDTPEIEDMTPLFKGNPDEIGPDHHFRKPANDITAQLEINFGDLGRPGRGRGGARGGRGGRGGGGGRSDRPVRTGGVRPEKPGGVSVPNVDDPEAFPALA